MWGLKLTKSKVQKYVSINKSEIKDMMINVTLINFSGFN